LDASTAPQLAGLLASVAGTGATPATASASPLLGAAALVAKGPLASTQLASGILNAYQTTHAQIGRSLAISAVPRSLATASSAEIVVSLNADETATPTYYDGPHQGANANISRVATHDTSTRVRVESVKLFEISSFAAVLQKSRSRFPLLPPFLELPYIGTIAGIPLPPAKEYHQSTAILSAVVVPTAADLAYGLQFMFDDVVDSDQPTCSLIATAGQTPCRLRRALSPSDLKQPVNGFHRQMVHCLGTGMWSPYSSLNGLTLAGKSACNNLAFSQIPK
jgi:hypothetical protein